MFGSEDFEIDDDLLITFKRSIGDFNNNRNPLDEQYYKEFLETAISDLITDDIDQEVLNSKLGRKTIVLYAKNLMDGLDIATNPTIELLRNKLSLITKGDRYDV